ncbi:alpha/beta hydrolase [Actinomadura sp. ATCC 31491]|uniref:Alpha/beta hydrolase n=1 Tax=Actinomadura luzonensis TaxID=2805427 RepID=A0ABT0FTP7_9ACTN|nr:alpha/beta hydrolase fold domain-containing protein [Actinomadura luzonensis]MCK2215708.1 alpha/beta hydrolase [Actinomadura luzonensis]
MTTLPELTAPPDPAALPLPAPAHPDGPGARLLRGAVYALRDGTRPLELDLWLPAGAAGPAPLVVFLHGGGWRRGLRGDFGPRFRHWRPGPPALLAGAGFAVACPAYRLSGEAPYPAQLDDVRAALGWLRARAGELAVDAARTVVWGESAGGHLAALAALTEPGVRGCVAWYPPTDLAALAADHDGPLDPADPGARTRPCCWAAPPPRTPGRPARPAPSRT